MNDSKENKSLEEILKEFAVSNPNVLLRSNSEAFENLPEEVKAAMLQTFADHFVPRMKKAIIDISSNLRQLYAVYDLPLTEESTDIMRGKLAIMRAFIAIFSLGGDRHVHRTNE